MKLKLTFADELAFWKLCGWRVEQYTKGSDNTRDKETKTIVHHPKCTCVITDRNCTCIITCNKITDVNVIYGAAKSYFEARVDLKKLMREEDTRIEIVINSLSPSVGYAIIEAVLDYSKRLVKLNSRKGKQNVTKSERN